MESNLRVGECVLAWFEPDLDQRLNFSLGHVVVLTDQRVLSLSTGGALPQMAGQAPPVAHCQEWPLNQHLQLATLEYGGAGLLELVGPHGRLAFWRYTPGRVAAARRLPERLAELRRGPQLETDEDENIPVGPTCPTCGEVLTSDQFACPVCAGGEAPATTKTLFRLLRFARPRAGMIVLGFVLTLVSTAAGLVPPYLTMPLLDKILVPYQNGQPDVDFSRVPWYLFGLAAAAVFAWLLGWARTYVLAWVSERVSADLRTHTYAHLNKLSLEFFGGKRTGDLISRVSSDSDRICFFLSVHLLDFANDVLMMVMTAVILLSIDPFLALVTLAPLPLIAALVQRVRSRLRQGFHMGSAAWGEMTAVLADTIPGIRVVKAFAQERREIERFRLANDRVLQANDRVNTLWSFFGPMVVLLTDAGLLVIWVFGVWRVYHHHITVGVLTAFVAYIGRFYARLDSMSRMVSAVQRAAASAQRIFEILDRVPSVAEPLRPVEPQRLSGAIELRGINFQYGNRRVLHEVNLKIAPGEMIGLVGPSGAGKTTLINLLCRFYDVLDGAILVDGIDIRSIPLESYRRHIGLVLQEPFLFFGTIAENIAYGRPDATREEIIAAARAARAHEFILRTPDGYDSLVGERGQSLSGGERQRISIARALLIDPRILILDEATSSVDTETEREIQLALENLIEGRTTIAIAHRLSTLRRADRLVVLERGQIAEIGRHQELLDTPGTYARLYRAQLEMDAGQAIAANPS